MSEGVVADMKSQDKKILIGGGIGIAALAYFLRRHTSDQGPGHIAQHDHHKHGEHEHDKNERGEYGKKHKHHHHED
jgi:hypothetical protein